MKKLFSLVFGVFLLGSFQVHAQTYTVGVENISYHPFYDFGQANKPSFSKELLDKFAAKQGYTFKYEAYPVVRLTKNFVDGQLDLKFPDNEYWAAKDKQNVKVVYSTDVVKFTDGVMVVPDRKGKGVSGFKNLGTVRGFTPWDFMALIKEGKVVAKETSSLDALVQQATHNRVDGAYFNVDVAKYYLANDLKKPDALVFDESLPHTTSAYKLSSIKHPKIIEAFNQFLTDEAAWIAELKQKYGIGE